VRAARSVEVQDVRATHHVEVDVHTRAPGELERRAPDPGWIDRAIVAEGVLLYREPGGAPETQQASAPRYVREEPPREWESVGDWLGAATTDMTVIEHELALTTPVWPAVAYHAQQAAEKSLNAALVMRDRVPPRTHDLDVLLAELIESGAPLDDLSVDCAHLEPYFVQGRYPGTGAEADEATGRELVECVRRIVAAVTAMRR